MIEPSFSEVRDVIALYCPRATLELFADHWSRWPFGHVAGRIAENLDVRSRFYQDRKPDVAIAMLQAASTIRKHQWDE